MKKTVNNPSVVSKINELEARILQYKNSPLFNQEEVISLVNRLENQLTTIKNGIY